MTADQADDDLVQQGLEHLQAAAREMIQASRSLLDAAEQLVDDPRAVQHLVATLGSVATAAAARLRPDVHGATDDPDDDDDGRVQRIRIS
jgi:hypothetical protein